MLDACGAVAEPLVSYTGHPLVDVGAAALTVMAGKERPEELALDDLDEATDRLLKVYKTEFMRSYLSTLFPNSAYVNPTMGVDKREAFYETYLRAYRRAESIGARCAFTGRPAQLRVYRQHLPLITGEGLFNFLPEGEPGLPVSGVALLCIQAMPLATLKAQGRALLVHSSDNVLTLEYAREFFNINEDAELLASLGSAGVNPRTMVLRQLVAIQERTDLLSRRRDFEAVTVYHFTNYGTNADIEIYPLPNFVVEFLIDVQGLPAWKRLVQFYWQPAKKGAAPVRNFLYEEIFGLPGKAASFASHFLLGRPRWGGAAVGPRATWEVVDLFLRKVVNMPQSRIDAIRAIAENLAVYIGRTTHDQRLLSRIFRGNSFNDLIFILTRANVLNAQKALPPVMTFDQCLEAFAIAEDLQRPDWRLARDLMLLRLLEAPDMQELLKAPELQAAVEEELAAANPASGNSKTEQRGDE